MKGMPLEMKLLYTPEAIDDLQRLREFIEVKNPEAVARIGQNLIQGISKLKDLPYMGRKVLKAPNPEMVRDLSVDMYIARYLVLENEIHVLRIWHKRENWANV